MKPTISVVVPAYNEEKLIGKCVESLQNQTYSKDKYEIIVVDNGSTDHTNEIAKKLGAKVFQYTEEHRVSEVRNYGASQAEGEIIAFVDGDSIASQNFLQTIERQLKNTKLVAVAGKVLPTGNNSYLRLCFNLYHYLLLVNQYFGIVIPWGLNLAVRRTAFNEIGGFNSDYASYEDATIGLTLQKRFGKKSINYNGELLVYTSARKHQTLKSLFLYVVDTIRNYTNFVILKRTKSNGIKVRYIR